MISRLITCTIKGDKLDEFRRRLNTEFLPRIQEQAGFIDNIESMDHSTGQFSCMTLWQDMASVQQYDNTLFQEVASNLGPLMETPPQVTTLPVENSSTHQIKAGKAAA